MKRVDWMRICRRSPARWRTCVAPRADRRGAPSAPAVAASAATDHGAPICPTHITSPMSIPEFQCRRTDRRDRQAATLKAFLHEAAMLPRQAGMMREELVRKIVSPRTSHARGQNRARRSRESPQRRDCCVREACRRCARPRPVCADRVLRIVGIVRVGVFRAGLLGTSAGRCRRATEYAAPARRSD